MRLIASIFAIGLLIDVFGVAASPFSLWRPKIPPTAAHSDPFDHDGAPASADPFHMELPAKGVLSYIELPQSLWGRVEWMIPVAVGIVAFTSFARLSAKFHDTVQWISCNTWLPESKEDINLQANVITQVINGPVITSISVLFGTLVSVTVATLHARQFDVQKSFIIEMQTLRQLQSLLNSQAVGIVLDPGLRRWAMDCLVEHAQEFLLDDVTDGGNGSDGDPHAHIESNLMTLIDKCNGVILLGSQKSHPKGQIVIVAIRDLALKLIKQRTNRWLALTALRFPAVHYLTLSLLAAGIGVSFLVATDEAEFIFLHGLPVRILWTILLSSFAALAVVLNDLARPFGGAYRVVPR